MNDQAPAAYMVTTNTQANKLHDYRFYFCCPCRTNRPALQAISCFLLCQAWIDTGFLISNFGALFRRPRGENNEPWAIPWIIFIWILIWAIATVGSLITHIIARCKFRNGGEAKITKTTLIFAMFANGFGSLFYSLIIVVFFYIGLALGTVEHPTFKAVSTVFIVAACILITVLLLLISQMVAGCKALR